MITLAEVRKLGSRIRDSEETEGLRDFQAPETVVTSARGDFLLSLYAPSPGSLGSSEFVFLIFSTKVIMSYPENNPSSEQLLHSNRSTVKRVPQRGSYERELIYQILDEGFICYVSFVVDGQPFVIPTAYGRVEDKLYIHGSPASRMLQALQTGIEVCVCVTLVDGLVLARSAFHHSLNYRSVVIFGTATIVKEQEQKLEALYAFCEHIIPERWQEVRPPNRQELNSTLVLALPLTEASAKMRTGAPIDDEKDYELPIWAGVIPLNLIPGEPISDPRLSPDIPIPASVRGYNIGLSN